MEQSPERLKKVMAVATLYIGTLSLSACTQNEHELTPEQTTVENNKDLQKQISDFIWELHYPDETPPAPIETKNPASD